MNSASHTVYDKATGRMLRVYEGPDPELQAQTGEGIVAGSYDMTRQRVDVESGEVYQWNPPDPDDGSIWDPLQWRWVSVDEQNAVVMRKIVDIEASQARAVRDLLLRNDRSRLDLLDSQIAQLRSSLK